MEKRGKKRILSLFLAFAMLLGSVSVTRAEELGETPETKIEQGVGRTVYVQIDGYNMTVERYAKVTMPGEYHKLSEYGFAVPDENDPGYYTGLHALAQYYVDTYEGGDKSKGAGYVSVSANEWGLSWENMKNPADRADLCGRNQYCMFAVNHRVPADSVSGLGYTIDQYPLQENDFICAYVMHYSAVASGHYAWFETSSLQSPAEEPFGLKLQAIEGMGESASAAGAEIEIQDESGNAAGEDVTGGRTYVTDADGNVHIAIDKPGTYWVSASRKSEFYDESGNLIYDISKPYCKVIVTAPVEKTPEQIVQETKDSLQLNEEEALTRDITLPVSGTKGARISWESSRPDILGSDGKVNRQAGKNVPVTLTATITKDAVTDTKTFHMTVKGRYILRSLSVSPGSLTFEEQTDHYTVYVPAGQKTVDIRAVAEEEDTVFVEFTGLKPDGSVKSEKKFFPALEEMTFQSYLSDRPQQDICIAATLNGGVKGTTTITVKYGNPAKPLPDLSHSWGQHMGNDSNNAVTANASPYENGKLLWQSASLADNALWGSAGYPLLVDDRIYVARNDEIQILNPKTGAVVKSAPLNSNMGYYSYITYGEGKVFVPLGNGQIQCFDAKTLVPLFLTAMPGLGMQGLNAVYYKEGMIYAGFGNGAEPEASTGIFAAYETLDLYQDQRDEVITPVWSYDGGRGYYGVCPVVITKGEKDYLVIGGDDGKATVFTAGTGEKVSEVQLKGAIRGSAVESDGYAWITTRDAMLYKLSLSEDGMLRVASQAALPLPTNASTAVAGGKVYVTGGVYKEGFLSVFDMDLKELAKVSTDGAANTPTVTTAYDDTYVYFTQYTSPGALFAAKVTASNKITLTTLYEPQKANYGMSNVVIGGDGTIYYGNDSGYLFAICAGQSGENPGENPPADPNKGTGGGSSAGAANGGTAPEGNTGVSTRNFAPTKTSLKVSAKKTAKESKTESEKMGDAIAQNAGQGEKSLTIQNVPEVLGAAVFAELAKHPDFQLILDCNTYTISIKGSDVTNTEAMLNTKLIEEEGTLKEEQAAKVGTYAQIALNQEGPFPGRLTIVYQLPAKLRKAQKLYLYEIEDLDRATEVRLQKQYAMFILGSPGTYVIGTAADEAALAKVEADGTMAIPGGDAEAESKSKIPAWVWLALAVVGGGVAGAVLTGAAIYAKRKKEMTWET